MDAYNLIHDGILALADVEANGIRIDVTYCKTALDPKHGALGAEIRELQEKVRQSSEGRRWHKHYGHRMNVDSGHQLSHVLYDMMGLEPKSYTETGQPSTDEAALRSLKLPFLDDLLRLRKLTDTREKLRGVLREQVDGVLHPFFNLHTVLSFRSSSNSPNFQNQNVRDKELAAILRRAFIPRRRRQILELDYKGLEVSGAACVTRDRRLIDYVIDKTKDMHRDMAMECFELPADEITKEIRYGGKNMFVFPEFYGDYWFDCATSLWEYVTEQNLKTASGKSVLEHLRSIGIKKLGTIIESSKGSKPQPGTFMAHIAKVEDDFWNDRFREYTAWKKKFYSDYCKRGHFDTVTGFRCSGVMRRNQVLNLPIQGPSFHCLLKSLIELNGDLVEQRFESMIIGQIHDSMVLDIVPGELDDLLGLAHEIMCERIRKSWDWIIVPLEVEAEISPVDGSWFDKKKIAA